MKTTTVTIAKGKRNFSLLIKESAEKNEDIVITKQGRPMAVIVPYEKYLHTRKVEGRRKILESRAAFVKAGVSADEICRESRKELERRG